MISIRLEPEQSIYHLIDLIQAWRQLNHCEESYTVEFGGPTRYIIEPGSRAMADFIRTQVHTNTIHRTEDRNEKITITNTTKKASRTKKNGL